MKLDQTTELDKSMRFETKIAHIFNIFRKKITEKLETNLMLNLIRNSVEMHNISMFWMPDGESNMQDIHS